MPKQRRLSHGMLLDAKAVMDNALPELAELKELIPECLHDKYEAIVDSFEDTLCSADVAKDYTEIERTR